MKENAKLVAVTQSVVVERSERRDCLDQRWCAFFKACGLTPVLLPNQLETAQSILETILVSGVVLTGGNDLLSLGGDAPERDALETFLVKNAIQKQVPLIGVCRGMQVIQSVHGIPLQRIEGHVCPELEILVEGKPQSVNSYHRFGTKENAPPLVPWAVALDGVVKAVRHSSAPVVGVMWHPERFDRPRGADVELFGEVLGFGR